VYRSGVVVDNRFVVMDDIPWNGATEGIANNNKRIASIVGVADGIVMELLLLFRILLGCIVWVTMFLILWL